MSFSEDRIASKASFTSSGSYTTVGGGGAGQTSFSGSGVLPGTTGGGGGDSGRWEEGEESGSGLLPPEIRVNKPGTESDVQMKQ